MGGGTPVDPLFFFRRRREAAISTTTRMITPRITKSQMPVNAPPELVLFWWAAVTVRVVDEVTLSLAESFT